MVGNGENKRWHDWMQVLAYQSDVLSHKQQSKRLQEDNQRLQNQMLATGERLEKMNHDNSLDVKKEMLKLQRQLAGAHASPHYRLSLPCIAVVHKSVVPDAADAAVPGYGCCCCCCHLSLLVLLMIAVHHHMCVMSIDHLTQ